jgi:hypothetical protein
MNKTFKKIIIGIFVVAVILVVGFFAARYYAYYGGKRDVQSEKAAFVLKTKDIVTEFTSNETAANVKYLEKPVAITGVVTSVNEKEVILDEIGVCNFLNQDASIKVGQTITVKGRVIGYDDILGGINLDQCSINK